MRITPTIVAMTSVKENTHWRWASVCLHLVVKSHIQPQSFRQIIKNEAVRYYVKKNNIVS